MSDDDVGDALEICAQAEPCAAVEHARDALVAAELARRSAGAFLYLLGGLADALAHGEGEDDLRLGRAVMTIASRLAAKRRTASDARQLLAAIAKAELRTKAVIASWLAPGLNDDDHAIRAARYISQLAGRPVDLVELRELARTKSVDRRRSDAFAHAVFGVDPKTIALWAEEPPPAELPREFWLGVEYRKETKQ